MIYKVKPKDDIAFFAIQYTGGEKSVKEIQDFLDRFWNNAYITIERNEPDCISEIFILHKWTFRLELNIHRGSWLICTPHDALISIHGARFDTYYEKVRELN